MEIKDMIELMKAVSENALTSFELEQGDLKITMKREKKVVTPTVQVVGAPAVPAVPAELLSGQTAGVMPAAQPADPADSVSGGTEAAVFGDVASDKVVTSPLVGTFYSSPSPDAENFVKVGDTVKKGQVLGIVEAMKLMNEIESEYDGIVDAILVKNEEVVEYGQPLFRIR